jgi:hypothetical protein
LCSTEYLSSNSTSVFITRISFCICFFYSVLV